MHKNDVLLIFFSFEDFYSFVMMRSSELKTNILSLYYQLHTDK